MRWDLHEIEDCSFEAWKIDVGGAKVGEVSVSQWGGEREKIKKEGRKERQGI